MQVPLPTPVDTLDPDGCSFCFPREGDGTSASVCWWHKRLLTWRLLRFLLRTGQIKKIWRAQR